MVIGEFPALAVPFSGVTHRASPAILAIHGARAFSSQVETKFTEGNHLTTQIARSRTAG